MRQVCSGEELIMKKYKIKTEIEIKKHYSDYT